MSNNQFDIETLSFDSFERNASLDVVCLAPIRTVIRREEEVTLVRKVRKVEDIEAELGCPVSTIPTSTPQPAGSPFEPVSPFETPQSQTPQPETGEIRVYANASVDQIRDQNIYELRDHNQFVGTLWGQGLLPSITNHSDQTVTVEITVDQNSQWTYGPRDGDNQFDLLVGADGNLDMADKEAAEQDMLFHAKAPYTIPPAALVAFKVGDNPFGYDYVAHGKHQRFTLQSGETVYFISNDEPGFYHDNTGYLTLRWETRPV